MGPIVRIQQSARLSRIVVHNGVVYLGGESAKDRTQDIRGQTEELLGRIDALLAEAGTDKTRLLSAQILLADIDRDFAALNEIWETWLVPGTGPARVAYQCKMPRPEILVEIIITAAMP